MSETDRAGSVSRVVHEVSRAVIGKDHVLRTLFAAMISGGHVLIEDVPGVAKTLIARSFSQVLEMRFSRIQFTPDLLPGDIVGSNIYDRERGGFEFVPGPLFAHLVLADEINRASPKTQSALLEAMEEGHVTVDGVTRPLEAAFVVIATQNPIELEGTYPLPEAQLDRFLIRLAVGYPSRSEEVDVLMRRGERKSDEVTLERVLSVPDLRRIRREVEEVHFDRSLCEYVVALVRATREDRRVEVGASPRGAVALFKMARATAFVAGRDYALPDDVKSVAGVTLAHRIVLKPEFWAHRTDAADVVADALTAVPVPGPEEAVGGGGAAGRAAASSAGSDRTEGS